MIENRRDQYLPPSHLVDSVRLSFDIRSGSEVIVSSSMRCRRNGDANISAMRLFGVGLDPASIRVDGSVPSAMSVGEDCVDISELPDEFEITSRAILDPSSNSELSGLYLSNGRLFTQCEAEGFRRIAWHPDRPDVLSTWEVEISAGEDFPVLLSNGNPVSEVTDATGRRTVTVSDPHPKPSYLFALVAGGFGCLSREFVSKSGRKCQLRFWAEESDVPRLAHAMDSLERSMRWDEERFGLEIDLDVYNVVAVSDFNMGAMENKGLNVFNTKYVLADPDTATDTDYANIESVVAHEYFHNWTGNRVTVRSWFELTLKEGLTVYRDQEFSADSNSRGVFRINDVSALRSSQFREDAGGMSHPIRPESYRSIDNFYTSTVYEKGAEVVRIYESLLGRDGFRKGIDLYFSRHDGSAVTCDDFRAAMADANGVDLSLMERWYSQAGTPVVTAEWLSIGEKRVLRLSQETRDASGNPGMPVPIPVSCGFLSREGSQLPDTPRLLVLDSESADFEIGEFPFIPVASLLRGFSAPVRLRFERPESDLAILAAHDTDPFCRWEAMQTMLIGEMLHASSLHGQGMPMPAPSRTIVDAMGAAMFDADPAMSALLVSIPPISSMDDGVTTIDPLSLHAARTHFKASLSRELSGLAAKRLAALPVPPSYQPSGRQPGERSLRSALVSMLCEADPGRWLDVARGMLSFGDNLTDRMAGLRVLMDMEPESRWRLFDDFISSYPDPLVVDKAVMALLSSRGSSVGDFRRLLDDAFSVGRPTPNRLYSTLWGFASNVPSLHSVDGSGYSALTDAILMIDPVNQTVASRAATRFSDWTRHSQPHSGLMRDELGRLSSSGLSRSASEIVDKAMAMSCPRQPLSPK